MASTITSVRAYFLPSDFQRYMSALSRLEQTAERLENDLPRLNAIDYSQLLANNILSGKHMSGFAQYSERYQEWKDQWATYTGFWQAMGHLVNSITHWEDGHGKWRAGIPEGVTDVGGTSWFGMGDRGPPKPIAMYAKTMEYGENRQPERPIFHPTLEEYKAGGYVRRGERALKTLGTRWR